MKSSLSIHLLFYLLLTTVAAQKAYAEITRDDSHTGPDVPSDKTNPIQLKPNKSPLIVKHYQNHPRYEYGLKLLNLALKKSGKGYKIIAPETEGLNEARGEMMVISGKIDVQWMSTNSYRESELLPIKQPIYKGILGLRLLLVKKEDLSAIHIRSISDLQNFVGGHGKHWGDLPVYPANGLKVVANTSYDRIFEQLILGRFDYFHRGVNEIWNELEKYEEKLGILDGVMLFYPHPVYFFVSPNNQVLAETIDKGLKTAIQDGSFKRLFLNEHREYIKKAGFSARKLIVLDNPVVPRLNTPIDTSWWLPEEKAQLITNHNN